MLGDKLVITDYHRQGAAMALPVVMKKLAEKAGAIAVSVAGESGSGKSETAHCLADLLEKRGKRCVVLAQDDYFKLPPRSNHEKRQQDISWVGPGEVKLDLLARHIDHLCGSPGEPLEKPLVDFDRNEISSETLDGGPYDLVIAEGTYTSLLPNAQVRVFIDRNYHQTKKARLRRARDPDVSFLEQVLEIEHLEISRHKARADVVIPPPPEEMED